MTKGLLTQGAYELLIGIYLHVPAFSSLFKVI